MTFCATLHKRTVVLIELDRATEQGFDVLMEAVVAHLELLEIYHFHHLL
jgi:hypothetical protein